MSKPKCIYVVLRGNSASDIKTFIEAVKDIDVIGTSFPSKKRPPLQNAIDFEYGQIFIDETAIIRLYGLSDTAPDFETAISQRISDGSYMVSLSIVNASSDPNSPKRVLIELFKQLPQDDLVQAAIAKLNENKDENS